MQIAWLNKILIGKFLLSTILLSLTGKAYSQIADSLYRLNEAFIDPDNDTFPQSDTIKIIRFDQLKKSNQFYDSLENKASRNKFTHQVHNLLVSRTGGTQPTANGNNSENYFERFNGKYIRNISIRQLNVFGPSVTDTAQKNINWSQKVGNSLHISTNKSTIKNALFINENEKADAFILADNERILRNIPNIQDARIYLFPVAGSDDSVDVQIVTKDVWPVGFGFEPLDVAYGNVSIWNNNILGLGQQLYFKAYYNYNADPYYGYYAQYRIPNIGNTFTSFSISHEDRWNLLANKIYLRRNFITPAIRFGFGSGYEKVNAIIDYQTRDSVLSDTKTDYELYDFWAGYSVPFGIIKDQNIRRNLFISSRFQKYNYFESPETAPNFLYEFSNRNIFLTSLGITWQGYYRTRLILGFGDTEDLPYGAMIKFTGGKEYRESSQRYYLGTNLSFSQNLSKLGFISAVFETGGFYSDSLEQGILRINTQYISPLIGSKRHVFRQFINFGFTKGYNRFLDEFVEIRKDYGIRGISSTELRGDRKFSVNTEFVYYSPYYLYGFRFVYYAFADAAMVNFSRDYLLNNPVYSSIGIGMRIRNERLVFNTIQLQLNYFPFAPDSPEYGKTYAEISGQPRLRMPEFADRIPEVIDYDNR